MAKNDVVCKHIREISEIRTSKKLECDECIKIGAEWVHLRVCQSCGATLCCDSSIHKHNEQAFPGDVPSGGKFR